MMNYKAFVSSTFVDLKQHRFGVIDGLRKAGIFVDPMEDWSADSDEPKQLSLDRMRDCDLCILLVGARRGHGVSAPGVRIPVASSALRLRGCVDNAQKPVALPSDAEGQGAGGLNDRALEPAHRAFWRSAPSGEPGGRGAGIRTCLAV